MDCFLLNRRKDGPEWSIRPASVEEIEPLRIPSSRNVPAQVKVFNLYSSVWYMSKKNGKTF